jgi:hypothetical protein
MPHKNLEVSPGCMRVCVCVCMPEHSNATHYTTHTHQLARKLCQTCISLNPSTFDPNMLQNPACCGA